MKQKCLIELTVEKKFIKKIRYTNDFYTFMANNKSAQKRIHINKRNRLKNRYYISSVRTMIKKFLNSLDNKTHAQTLLSEVYSLIDKGTKKRVYHKNTAARKKSRLAKYLKLL